MAENVTTKRLTGIMILQNHQQLALQRANLRALRLQQRLLQHPHRRAVEKKSALVYTAGHSKTVLGSPITDNRAVEVTT